VRGEAYDFTSLSEGEGGMEGDRKGILFSVINWTLGMDPDSRS